MSDKDQETPLSEQLRHFFEGEQLGPRVETGPWGDGADAAFTPWMCSQGVGYLCEVNGVRSIVLLSPGVAGEGSPVILAGRIERPGTYFVDMGYLSPPGSGEGDLELLARLAKEEEE